MSVFVPTTVLLFLSAGSVYAADDLALQHCRAMAVAAERLACYDAMMPVLGAAPAGEQNTVPLVATTPIAPPTLTATTATSAPPVAAVPATAAVVAAPAPDVASTQNITRGQTAEEFGLERQAAEARLEQIESHIAGLFQGWEPKSKITLANGQVWQVADGSHAVYRLESPTVTIERGVFGTFLLKIEGANRKPKVKRVK